MKIKINAIDFDVTAVPGPLRAVILADPVVAQGVWRDVWSWDAVSKSVTTLVQTVQGKAANSKAVPLGNGISFYVPRVGDAGLVVKNEGPSKKMAEKVLAATGAKTMTELMGAMNRIIHLPQKTLPLEAFAPLNGVASYRVRMHVDFAVLHLANAGRHLSFYLLVPGQCAFQSEVTAIPDQAAYDAALAETPGLATIQPVFVVPPQTKANLGLRTLALAKAIGELQDEMRAAGGPEMASDAQKRRAATLAAEWRLLRSTEAAQQQATAANGPAPIGRA